MHAFSDSRPAEKFRTGDKRLTGPFLEIKEAFCLERLLRSTKISKKKRKSPERVSKEEEIGHAVLRIGERI